MKTKKSDNMKENMENNSNEENTVEYIGSANEPPIILDKQYFMENFDIVQYSNLCLSTLEDGEEVVFAMRYHEGYLSPEELEKYVPYWDAVQKAYGKRVCPVFLSPGGLEEE